MFLLLEFGALHHVMLCCTATFIHAYVHCASAVKYVQVSLFALCAGVTRILTLDLPNHWACQSIWGHETDDLIRTCLGCGKVALDACKACQPF